MKELKDFVTFNQDYCFPDFFWCDAHPEDKHLSRFQSNIEFKTETNAYFTELNKSPYTGGVGKLF